MDDKARLQDHPPYRQSINEHIDWVGKLLADDDDPTPGGFVFIGLISEDEGRGQLMATQCRVTQNQIFSMILGYMCTQFDDEMKLAMRRALDEALDPDGSLADAFAHISTDRKLQ